MKGGRMPKIKDRIRIRTGMDVSSKDRYAYICESMDTSIYHRKSCYLRAVLCLAVLFCMMVLAGCSLAVPDAGEEKQVSQDRLIGAFITTEHLDLFDMEAYLNDHAGELVNSMENSSQEVVIDGREYSQRLYAVVDKCESTNPMDWEIVFGDVEGICLFDAKFQNEGEEPFNMLVGGEEICDVVTGLEVVDGGERVSISGTLYALVGTAGEIGFYVNPVYQTPEGDIYALTGDGYHMSGELGGSWKVNLEEETTLTNTEDGAEQTYGGAVEVKFEVRKHAPVEVRIQFMNEALEIIQTQEYAAGEMPEEMKAVEGTACVIAETEWADGSVTRELFELEREEAQAEEIIYVETFYKVSDTALGMQTTQIVWEQVQKEPV